MTSPEFVIVGAGAVGAATAYELSRSGARVLVLERSRDLSGCSYGSAGLISPSHSETLATPASIRHGVAWMSRRDSPFSIRPRLGVVPWLARFAAASLPGRSTAASAVLRALTQASLELHAELARSLPTSFARRGILGVYESPETFAAARERRAARAEPAVRTLSPDDARELIPGLSDGVAGALYYADEAHCDPAVFVGALLAAAQGHGAEVRTGVEVLSIRQRDGRIVGLETTAGPERCAAAVLTAGVWTRGLAHDLGLHVPLEGGKGYHVEVRANGSSGDVPAFLEDARVTATPLDGRVRFTGALELSGVDFHVDLVRLAAIRRAAQRTVGVPADARAVRIWRGLRPCAPDGLPIIGRADAFENLYIATGHAMLGIALAPVTGEIVGCLARGESPRFPVDRLAPARFRRVWPIVHNHTDDERDES
jgi:D-amino-acid dehydrogenase